MKKMPMSMTTMSVTPIATFAPAQASTIFFGSEAISGSHSLRSIAQP